MRTFVSSVVFFRIVFVLFPFSRICVSSDGISRSAFRIVLVAFLSLVLRRVKSGFGFTNVRASFWLFVSSVPFMKIKNTVCSKHIYVAI